MKFIESSKKMKQKSIHITILINIFGTFLYMVGIKVFAAPARIAPGGASGIAVLINYLTGFPIGLFCSLFSIPLLIIILWKKIFPLFFFWKTVGSILLLSFMTDIIGPMLPVYKGDFLLAAIFAGTFMGSGLALVYLGNSDTGGITLIGLIIQKKYPQFQVGTMISLLNFIIVLTSGIVYKNMENILYAIVTVYVSGLFMDRIVNNANAKNLMIVMSECTDKVRCIFLNEEKGLTLLKGEGGYTSETQRVIMSAVNKGDCIRIQKKIIQTDDKALIIVAEASKVLGKNFGHMI